jgi:hypothetical protein
MRTLLILTILVAPLCASAEYLDVIQVKLKDKCTVQKYAEIKNDFNEQWGSSHGYRAEIAAPLQSNDLGSVFWLGHCTSAEAFGKAWDSWRSELSDPKSVAGKLNERFEKCSTNDARRGYDLY